MKSPKKKKKIMLNFLLPLMKNPLTRIIADKTVSAINHSIEKKKVIRAKEIEAEANVSIEQIRSSKSSIKDEVLTIKITLIFLAIFWPKTQPWMEKGFEILISSTRILVGCSYCLLWKLWFIYSQ